MILSGLINLSITTFLLILFSGFVIADTCGELKCIPPVAFALDDDGPPEDVILLTQLTLDIGNAGYEPLPFGISEVYSKVDSIENKVTIVIHFGDVEIILSEDDPLDYHEFAKDMKNLFEKRDINTKITLRETLETENLTKLYKKEEKIKEEIIIEEEPEIVEEVIIIKELPKVEPIKEPEPVPIEIIEEKPKNIFFRFFTWIANLFA